MKRLALARLSRILAKPDADPFAVLRGSIEQQPLDIARIGPLAHHIQEPIAVTLIATELDADTLGSQLAASIVAQDSKK